MIKMHNILFNIQSALVMLVVMVLNKTSTPPLSVLYTLFDLLTASCLQLL